MVSWGWVKQETLSKYERFFNGLYFEAFINIINASNLVALYIEDYFSVWAIISLCYLLIYWMEAIGKILSMGVQNYFKKFANKFDTVLNILSLIILIVYSAAEYDTQSVLKFVLVLRTFRILKLLGEIQEYRIIFKTFVSLMPMYARIFGILVFTFYIYSTVGQYIYGGMIFKEQYHIIEDTTVPNVYVYNNFNDFASGLVTLFELLIVNNWWVIAEMYTDVVQNKWSRLYFASFYFWAVLIVINLVVAFVIDMFTANYEIMEQREGGRTTRRDSIINELDWARSYQNREMNELEAVNLSIDTESSQTESRPN